MHWMLRVISLGHVRTFTHHRLLLLEQKFNLHVMLNAGEARCCVAFFILYVL
jgi:AMP deaminase